MIDAASCPGPVDATFNVVLALSSSGQLSWTFSGAAANPPDITVTALGNLNFSQRHGPLHVVVHIDNSASPVAWRWLLTPQVQVFGYADGLNYANVAPVGQAGNHQIKQVTLPASTDVDFCYMNHNDGGIHNGPNGYPQSRYVMYVLPGDASAPIYRIDPIISNGGNPS